MARAAEISIADRKGMVLPGFARRPVRRVTELLGFPPGADEHKVQWLSTSGDDRSRRCSAKSLSDGPRLDALLRCERFSRGGFSAKFYERLGLERRRADSRGDAPARRAGLQRAVEDDRARMAGEGENLCVAGGLF
jgi:carbamoyltransferase